MPQRYGRFALKDGRVAWALIADEQARLLSGPPYGGGQPTGERLAVAALRRLAPVTPSKIIGIGRNYHAHAMEMGEPVPSEPLYFLKACSSLLEPGGTVRLPPESQKVEHEAELGVIIGRRCRRVPVTSALACVAGYTVVGDITARDLQKRDGQWTRAKSFDTFCPVGPELVTDIDTTALTVRAWVNGALRQNGNTRDMVFGVAAIVAHVSQAMTLEPGDLIATGTPEGVGPLHDGDHLAIEVATVGRLEVEVRTEA